MGLFLAADGSVVFVVVATPIEKKAILVSFNM